MVTKSMLVHNHNDGLCQCVIPVERIQKPGDVANSYPVTDRIETSVGTEAMVGPPVRIPEGTQVKLLYPSPVGV